MDKIKERDWWWLVAALFFAFAFQVSHPEIFAFGGVLSALRAVQLTTTLQAFMLGVFILGFGKYASALAWIWDVYPLTWLAFAPGFGQLGVFSLYWIVFTSIYSISFGAVLTVWWLAIRRFVYLWLTFPIAWVLAELAGALTFSLVMTGPGSYPNVHFGTGMTGVLLGSSAWFAQLAVGTGILGLSAMVATAGMLLHGMLYIKKVRAYVIEITLVVVLVVVWVQSAVLSRVSVLDEGLAVVTVETYFSNDLVHTDEGFAIKEQSVRDAIETALVGENRFLVLPEDSGFTAQFSSTDEALAWLLLKQPQQTTVVVDNSEVRYSEQERVMRTYYYDLPTESVYVIDKQYLVPQGEYMPVVVGWALEALGYGDMVASFVARRTFVPGPISTYEEVPRHLPGSLFCAAAISPFGVSSITSERADTLIFNPASYGWFRDSENLPRQIDAALRIQAVQHNLTIVRAGNEIPNQVFNPNGTSYRVGEVLHEATYWKLIRYGN